MEEDLQNPETANHIYAFDLEWSVDLAHGIQGRIGLISLAHNKSIYLRSSSTFM
jgi:hypothetical protein